jgi:hypothetical protein
MGMGTGIFSNCGYGDEDYSTLPIPYPLPSLISTNYINGHLCIVRVFIKKKKNSYSQIFSYRLILCVIMESNNELKNKNSIEEGGNEEEE